MTNIPKQRSAHLLLIHFETMFSPLSRECQGQQRPGERIRSIFQTHEVPGELLHPTVEKRHNCDSQFSGHTVLHAQRPRAAARLHQEQVWLSHRCPCQVIQDNLAVLNVASFSNSIVILLSDDLPIGSAEGSGDVTHGQTSSVTHPFVTQTYCCIDAYETKDIKNRPFKVAVDEKLDVLIKDPTGQCWSKHHKPSSLNPDLLFTLISTKLRACFFVLFRLVAGGEWEQVLGLVSCSVPGVMGRGGRQWCCVPAGRYDAFFWLQRNF